MNIKEKVAGLVMLGLAMIGTSATASDVILSSSFDPASGEIAVVVALDSSSGTVSNFKFSLDYSSNLASFTKAVYPNASVTSYASSKAGATGQVSGNAAVDFSRGNTAVTLYFAASGAGSLTGVFQSIMLDGNELGPVTVPAISFNGSTSSSNGSTSSSSNTDPVAPTDIITNGMNHSIGVHWSHPEDNVSEFHAEAWLLLNTGELSGPVASCDATGTDRMCVITGLRNGRLYRVVVSASYPAGAVYPSDASDPAIPFASNVNGLCFSSAFVSAPERVLGSRRMCRAGQVAGYTFDGVTAHWWCVGRGHGATQVCTSP